MNDTPTPETGAETKEAWAAVSRTPDGMYDSRIPISAYAYAMNDHSRKMERERDEMKEQCDLLTEQLDFQRNLSREYFDLNTGWRKKFEFALEMAALATVERDEARGIIAACMSELPVGYIPAHTPENLPSRIADLVGQLVGLERERDAAQWCHEKCFEDRKRIIKELNTLQEQVKLTIMENLHLADGDNCTLKRLKDAIGFSLDSPDNA
jgi:hypothetical protein